MTGDDEELERREVWRIVRQRVLVGYSQRCAICRKRFASKKPATTCSNRCRQQRKRQGGEA